MRIQVSAAGLNFAEITARQGLYPDAPAFPCIVGYEVAGTVVACGDGTTSLALGDRVLALTRFGGHADEVVVAEGLALPIPDAMPMDEAAAIPVNYLTAHHMLFHVGSTHPGSRVLLHMAAGGVGTAVLQLLQTVPDLTILGTASVGKHDYIRQLGCQHPIDYRTDDYVRCVRDVVGEQGVDLVLDPLGGRDWRRSWDLLAPAGRLVAFGFANTIVGPKRNLLHVLRELLHIPRFSPMAAMDHNRSLQGVNMGHLWNRQEILRPQLERIVALYSEGLVRPHIHARVPFSRAAEAHQMLEQRENMGKVLLIPDEGP